MARQSPAKREQAARAAADKAARAAEADGKSAEEIQAAAEAARNATLDGAGEQLEAKVEEADEEAEVVEVDRAELTEKMLPAPIRQRLKVRDELEAELLAEACFVFGINPDPSLRPIELAKHRFDPGDPTGASPVAPSVTLVTAGGLKIRYPVDEDTETRLRNVYHAFKVGKDGERQVLPLPADLTLPRENVDGVVRSHEHQYRTGYLREGGKNESDKRAATLKQLRQSGRIR
jgi:hypothetical protein